MAVIRASASQIANAANASHVNVKMKHKKLTKKTKFSEIVKDEDAARILMEKGMHCCGCPMAMSETLEQGAEAHGLDADEVVRELNKSKERRRK